jgi:hydrogenase expression/formation protein HypE
MEIGKLPNEVLKDRVISKIEIKNKDILVGPGVGEDCSIIAFDEELQLVQGLLAY